MRKWIGFAALLMGLAIVATPGLPSADAQAKDPKKDAKKDLGKKDVPKKAAELGTVEVTKDKQGKFRFRITDADDKVIAQPPKGYATKEEVLALLEQIKETLNKVKPTDAKD